LPLVLAIEPDVRQATIIKRIVREQVRAELILVDSRDAALAAIAARIPDVILLTALLSPRDEEELVSYLRTLAGAHHVQTHTIPQLASSAVDVDSTTSGSGGGLFGKLLRKKEPELKPFQGCDPSLFAEEIRTFIDRSAERKNETVEVLQQRVAHLEFQARPAVENDSVPPAGEPAGQTDTGSAWSSPFEWRRSTPGKADTSQRSSPLVTNVPLAVVAEDQEQQAAREWQLEAEATLKQEEEERERREADAQRQQLETEAKLKRDEEERTRLEAEAKRKREEEERKRLEAEAKRKREEEEEEERKRFEAESKRKREEEERKRLEAEAKRKQLEAEAKLKQLEAEAKLKQEKEEARRREEEEARRREEEEARRREEEEARRREEEEARRREEEEARRREAEEFAEFRADHDQPKGVLCLMPLSRWARVETQPQASGANDEPVVADEFQKLIAGLRIPPHVAVIGYGGGCRIRRVRVRALKKPASPGGKRQTLIVSRRALRHSDDSTA
jgi:hypothetical protein